MLAAPRIPSSATLAPVNAGASSSTQSTELRTFAFEDVLSPSGLGLGITYNARDIGPLAPPPTPRLASSEVLPPLNLTPISVEKQVLNAMPRSALYVRRHQKRNRAPFRQPRATRSHHSPTVHMPPMMAMLISLSINDREQRERVGLGISGVTFSSASAACTSDDSDDVIFEDGQWEYVKPSGFKSCKGRVCTPRISLGSDDSWL